MRGIICLFLFLGSTAFNTPTNWQDMVKADLAYLLDFYKTRHQHPELSLEEKETSKALASELRKAGFEVAENAGGYGVVGVLKNGKGPTILYRTDMDALPVKEKTGLDYASKVMAEYNGGEIETMHACGHDMHMTTLVGTARAMSKMKDKWKGTLLFIGQPAEEIGAGAALMLADGLYDKYGVPDYGLALHVSPSIPVGKVGIGKGYTMANAESIDVKIFGIGAHGASPHKSIDPIVIASMMVLELQTIVSRTVKPTESAVVTVGAIHGGSKHNIIPDEVTLKITVRTFEESVRLKIHERIRQIAKGTAIAAGLPEDKMPEVIIPESFVPANYNTPALVDRLIASSTKVIGKENVLDAEPLTVAEDFARYGLTKDKVPTTLFWLGTVPEERIKSGFLPGLHSPFYYPEPVKTIETGVAVVTQMLLDLLEEE